ncbi:hypothetical protein M2158_000442 [Streptomyces sp. SAI-144]|uniref:hypothetical protein n=1 Tax=Streptomyces sp. SAI-144 TaxID=2940544 RepID=UPI002474120D|nr:hypothetical protein [Streptomyces sp. SAI-144]MDH6431965.1 hypothetical protein [Streptomyces sp. SAI-144]
MQRPVVDAQRGMQVEPERLGPAEDASNDLIVDGQQLRALPGEEFSLATGVQLRGVWLSGFLASTVLAAITTQDNTFLHVTAISGSSTSPPYYRRPGSVGTSGI